MDPRDLDDILERSISRILAIEERVSDLEKIESPSGVENPDYFYNAIGTFLQIPGLRGFWPCSAADNLGAAIDLTGLHNLSNVGPAEFSWSDEIAPYCFFDGSNDYLWVASNADHSILGTETHILTTKRGLSIGGWHRPAALAPANPKGIIGKWNNGTNDRSYLIDLPNGVSTPAFYTSNTGLATAASIVSTFTMSVDTWCFILARYAPGLEISITVNGTQNEDTNLVGVPASLYNGSADFNIMAYNNGAAINRNHGRSSLNFLSCMYLSDAWVDLLFNCSKRLFGYS